MNGSHSIHLHIGDFMRAQAILRDPVAEIAYLNIQMAYWLAEGPLEGGARGVSRASKCSPQLWRHLKPALEQFFEVDPEDGLWHHTGLDIALERSKKYHTGRSLAASKAAKARWHGDASRNASTNASGTVDNLPHALPHASENMPHAMPRAMPSQTPIPLNQPTESPRPRLRARKGRVEGQKVKGVFGADPKAPNGHASPSRSSTPGFRQVRPTHVSPATANLMSQCARFLGPEQAGEFWNAMLGPNASTVLSQTADAMRNSGWKDAG